MRDTPNVGSIASWRINVKKYVWACGLTALFLGGGDSPIGSFSARNPFLTGFGLPDHVAVSTKLSTAG